MNPFAQLAKSLRMSDTPVTVLLIVSIALCYVIAWLGSTLALVQNLGLLTATAGQRPWTFLTYPWAQAGLGGDVLWFILGLAWLYWFGTPVERDHGSGKFALIFGLATVLGGISIWLGTMLLKADYGLFGAFLPDSVITVLWAARNANKPICFWGITIPGIWIGVLSTVLVLFSIGAGMPMLGLFALIPVVLAWLYGLNKLPIAYGTGRTGSTRFMNNLDNAGRGVKTQNKAYFDEVRKREQERQERDKLRDLFERSLIEDPDEKNG